MYLLYLPLIIFTGLLLAFLIIAARVLRRIP